MLPTACSEVSQRAKRAEQGEIDRNAGSMRYSDRQSMQSDPHSKRGDGTMARSATRRTWTGKPTAAQPAESLDQARGWTQKNRTKFSEARVGDV